MQDLAAEEEQRERAEERRPCGDDRPAQRLVDRHVDDVLEVVAPHRAEVLAHPVEDDDRVVRRIARDRQDRGDDVQRQVVAEEREERERDEQIVNRRDDRADAEAELIPERDVEQDPDERQHGREDALLRQLAADDRSHDLRPHIARRADLVRALPAEVAHVRRLERREHAVRGAAQARPGLGADARHADHQLVRRDVAVALDDRLAALSGHRLVERRAHLCLVRHAIELQDDDRAA